jgi:hypothetical protein
VRANPAYLIVILLSRVVTRLGGVEHMNPKVIESLYAADLAYLQNFRNYCSSGISGIKTMLATLASIKL